VAKTVVVSAKLKEKNQITIPKEILAALGVGVGGNVTFIAQKDRVVMMNPAIYAARVMQEAMRGEARRAGIYSDDDVLKLIKEIREEESGQ
jgi:bifunctional DNA-binding transcriptional regulator/antitoxin component of YhaV-PrlF toxin-antitoxin module